MSRGRTFICDGGPHTMHVPYPDCTNAAEHAPCPIGYVAWHEWAEATMKTHNQRRCKDCGYWVICEPKKVRGTS
jgi:hypothetical protein